MNDSIFLLPLPDIDSASKKCKLYDKVDDGLR